MRIEIELKLCLLLGELLRCGVCKSLIQGSDDSTVIVFVKAFHGEDDNLFVRCEACHADLTK